MFKRYLLIAVLLIAGCISQVRTFEKPEERASPVETPSNETLGNSKSVEFTPIVRKGPRRLLLGLDGIGFESFKKMQDGGYFRSFRPVAPMVATFPSISDPNWTRIMRAPLEVSFTKEHFDQSLGDGKGEVRGSLIDHVFHPPAYEGLFDFKQEGAIQRIASMTYSETSGIYWLDAIEKQIFDNPHKLVFKAFIMNTDFISHTKGEAAVFRYLSELDRKLVQLRQRYEKQFHEELEVILVSDHGNTYLKPKPVDVSETLQKDGWTLTASLTHEKDVVLVIPEILSFAPFFVKPSMEEDLAKSLSRAEGIHVSFFLSNPDQVDFWAQNGRSHTRAIFNTKRKSFKYRVLKGKDPFHHLYLFKGKEISYSKYFNESLASEYPNAIINAFEGLTQNSQQKPSVLVNPVPGYVFSNRTLEFITKILGLESVHGSLHRKEALGIFVSTNQDLPPVTPSLVMDFVN